MAKNIEKMTFDQIAADLVAGNIDVNELDLAKSAQREAFLLALDRAPSILTKVSGANSEHFLKYAIEKNYEYFVHLDRDQYTDTLAQAYIFSRMTARDARLNEPGANTNIIVQKSMDGKTVFNISYVTAEGDELYYMDKELNVPLALKSGIKLTLKLQNAVKLIDKLDVQITQLGAQKIKAAVIDIVATQYKAFLGSYINDKGVGYYTMCTTTSQIEAEGKTRISRALEPFGISVAEIIIKRLAIPKDIQYKIEDQALLLRQRKSEVAASVEMAKLSLESYEAKLAIQQKYPDADHALTEYEKDLALERYLTKRGQDKEEVVDHSIKITQKVEKVDTEIVKEEEEIPEIVPKPNGFKTGFIVAAVAAIAISGIVLAKVGMGAGIIALGASALILGAVGIKNADRFKAPKVEPNMILNRTSSDDDLKNNSSE